MRTLLLTLSALLFVLITVAQNRVCRYQPMKTKVGHPSIAQRHKINSVLYVPVVFHVVHRFASENVDDHTIYSQLQVLNEDFNRLNADTINTQPEFIPLVGNPRIEFYLAAENGINGITRTATAHGPFYNDDLHFSDRGGKDAWDSNRFLNVWIADLGGSLAGFASAPGSPADKDGVAVHYQYIARSPAAKEPFHLGRTLTHEVGHWLGLNHLWGVGGCNSDDGLSDTPRQESGSLGCPLNRESCGALNMVQNFMDTSDDACLNFFTKDQTLLMRSTLLTQRASVIREQKQVVTNVRERSQGITVFPNPVTDGQLSVVSHVPFELAITNTMGRIVESVHVSEPEQGFVLDTSQWPNAMYVATVSVNGQIFNTRIIVKNGHR